MFKIDRLEGYPNFDTVKKCQNRDVTKDISYWYAIC